MGEKPQHGKDWRRIQQTAAWQAGATWTGRIIEEQFAGIFSTIVATGRIEARTFDAWRELKNRITQLLPAESGDNRLKLIVNGHDLMNRFALPPGPLIGKLLDFLQGLILEEPALNQKEILFAKVKAYLEQNQK